MRILIAGATGFIGSAVSARLKAEGHEVWAVARRTGPMARRLLVDRWIPLDVGRATTPEAWRPHLEGVDAVINCVGALQDGGADSTKAVHLEGPAALFAACEAAGVRRVIHFSAMGADKAGLSAFSDTKRQGEEALTRLDLDWVILRPSVVVGRSAYGGSALFRGLAALPFLPRAEKAGQLQIVQLDEVVETVVFFLNSKAPANVALEIAGPERLSFEEVVAAYRRWLGYPPAKIVAGWATGLMYRLGDLAGALGWRPPIRSNARREMVRGAVGDNSDWVKLTGIRPRSLSAALAAEPASVQERWFSRLYLLKALALATFAAFWLMTAVVSIGPGFGRGKALMLEGGAGPLAGPSVWAGALADLVVFAGIAYRPTTRLALWAAIGLSVFYIVAGSLLLPRLWADPLGPMMKVWPILALNLVCLAILDDR
ncbi:SDR family oxidoreductase [Phenylobacterium sp.]|uniref:SDR family oxidoreductase n=1 Tax=Phenylobacterium sp. TaxID=1871053 RepID=UPI002F93E55B